MNEPIQNRGHEFTGRKLLVVDDEANNRDMLSRRLERRGYAVDVAESGLDALAKISVQEYDLVLLDQMMPGMTGLDLLRLLRATHTQSELPVIMVAALDQNDSVIEALDQGANDYVTKPIDLPIVNARIQSQLARSHSDREKRAVDSLTGLHSRPRFLTLIENALTQGHAALLLFDIDGFTAINDSFGHQAGDRMLQEVASRLKAASPAGSAIGRLGGDEFGVLLKGAEEQTQVTSHVTSIMDFLRKPFSSGNTTIDPNIHVGVAMSTTEQSAEELLGNAGLAIRRAKELGTNRWELFTPELRERVQSRLNMALDLRHAIERNQLVAFYQPKIQLTSRKIVGFEALLRWRHPELGLIPPYLFIPIAEETGLIQSIGEWILREACMQLKKWHALFPDAAQPLSMNINLSVKQLTDPQLAERVRSILQETGVPAQCVKLELTESSLVTEIESARAVLDKLQALQVGLNLDDFGTGYSSLSYLRTLHFDTLKIDRSFVSRLGSDPESHAIVETILKLAGALNMDVIAEGIEEEQQLSSLISLGCEVGQGYLFSMPVSAEAAEALLAARLAA